MAETLGNAIRLRLCNDGIARGSAPPPEPELVEKIIGRRLHAMARVRGQLAPASAPVAPDSAGISLNNGLHAGARLRSASTGLLQECAAPVQAYAPLVLREGGLRQRVPGSVPIDQRSNAARANYGQLFSMRDFEIGSRHF